VSAVCCVHSEIVQFLVCHGRKRRQFQLVMSWLFVPLLLTLPSRWDWF